MIEGVFVGLLFSAAAALVLQVFDAVLSTVDALTLRDSDEPDAATRRRLRELVWILAITATLAVLVAFGVDAAGRLIWEADDFYAGIAVLLLSAASAFLAGLVAVIAVLRRERPTYARLRRDLRDRVSLAMAAEELAEFDERLARSDRVRARRPVAALALRIVGLVLVLFVAVAGAGLVLVVGRPEWWLYAVAGIVELAAFIVAVRADTVRRSRLAAVLEAQRSEVVAMLERARIPQRGSVPGLRDRVTRALAILREKQR